MYNVSGQLSSVKNITLIAVQIAMRVFLEVIINQKMRGYPTIQIKILCLNYLPNFMLRITFNI